MASELGLLVHADLASMKADARNLVGSAADAIASAAGQHEGPGAGFAQTMLDAVRGVDAKDRLAAAKMDEVDSGRSDDLLGAMLSSQEASLSFSMLMQVRNKVMGAIDDLVKLPL